MKIYSLFVKGLEGDIQLFLALLLQKHPLELIRSPYERDNFMGMVRTVENLDSHEINTLREMCENHVQVSCGLLEAPHYAS